MGHGDMPLLEMKMLATWCFDFLKYNILKYNMHLI
jgi:hypothetical protein